MADTVNVKWLYPPNFDGNLSDDQRVGLRSATLQLTGDSDGTGEYRVKKLDISTLRMTNGDTPTRTAVIHLKWSINGFNNVTLEWDRAAYDTIAVLSGDGEANYECSGGLVDPSSSGDRTGDILLTSNGGVLGSSYQIEITVKLKGD